MPILSPTAGDVHVNKMLSNISIGYSNEEYIADQVFPIVMVDKQSDIIPAYTQDYWFRDDASLIPEGGVAPDIGYEVDTSATYYCQEYGSRHFISDKRRANQDTPFDADREATMLVTEKLFIRRERAFVSSFCTDSVWGTDKDGGVDFVKWSSFGSSDPITDVRDYKRTVRRLIGRDPNTLVLGDMTYDKLMDHPDVLDRIKYTERGIATTELLAALFDLDRVLVGRSIYASADEGASTQTYAANWDDDALLLYVAQRPSLYTPSAGYTFVWRTGPEAGSGPQWIRKYHDTEKRGDYVEGLTCYDQKATVSNAGAWLEDAVDA